MADQHTFNPQEHLIDLKGKSYLQVMWRLVWLRDTNPDASISTELVSLTDQQAVFRAVVTLPSGGSATGFGSETPRDFGDYIEKAETKAIGRALAALGFGTQFSAHEFGGEHERDRPVDSPAPRQNAQNAPQRAQGNGHNVVPAQQRPPQQNGQPMIQNPSAPASDKQINFIRSLAKDCGMTVQHPDGSIHTDDAAVAAIVGVDFGEDWPNITKGTASSLIEQLQAEKSKPKQSAMDPNAMLAVASGYSGDDQYTR